MPDVTVLMAIHNAMPHLPEAVESIRGQTLTDWRMVVVNDGSTDESVNYLLGLADPRIEIVHQENRGLGAALNHGLQHCDSPLIARMDGDDICYPTRLRRTSGVSQIESQCRLCGEHRSNAWAAGSRPATLRWPSNMHRSIPTSRAGSIRCTIRRSCVARH